MIESLLAAAAITFWSDRAGTPDVFTMTSDGGEVHNLGRPEWGDKRASWSPDGARIAYDSWHAGVEEFDIWVMDADGSNRRRVTTSPQREVLPVWSPRGDWIAYTRNRERSVAEDIWLIRPDGTGAHLLVRNGAGGAWSPDGARFVCSRGTDLYTVGGDGRRLRRLTRARGYDAASAGSWSPDGKKILFTRWPVGSTNGDIYVLNVRTLRERRLTRTRTDDTDASWSPDGKQILFDTTRDGNREVYVMHADGSSPRNLTRHPAEDYANTWH
jgi:Tol biopolymer transport system component